MNINKFLKDIDEILDELKSTENKQSFLKNMEHINVKDKTFAEWVWIYLAWNELSSEEDVKRMYGDWDSKNVQE